MDVDVVGSKVKQAGKTTADTTDKILTPTNGFNHVHVVNDGATELILTVDEVSTGSPSNPIYVGVGEIFSDAIAGNLLHYTVASGTTTLRYVIR